MNVTEVFSFGEDSYGGRVVLADSLDLEEAFFGDVGVEVFNGSSWVPSISLIWDPLFPTEFDFALEDISDPTGMPWRFISPVTGWTVDGSALNPSTGTITPYSEMLLSTPAKNADVRPLTNRRDLFK